MSACFAATLANQLLPSVEFWRSLTGAGPYEIVARYGTHLSERENEMHLFSGAIGHAKNPGKVTDSPSLLSCWRKALDGIGAGCLAGPRIHFIGE